MTRLLRLLDCPDDVPVLAPLIEREIHYRLLQGEQGALLRQAATAGSRLSGIGRAADWIRLHYAEPISVEALAGQAGMSITSFHRHFKAITTMSPLQYRTQIRLQEARRLMVVKVRPQGRSGSTWATRANPSSAASIAGCSACRQRRMPPDSAAPRRRRKLRS